VLYGSGVLIRNFFSTFRILDGYCVTHFLNTGGGQIVNLAVFEGVPHEYIAFYRVHAGSHIYRFGMASSVGSRPTRTVSFAVEHFVYILRVHVSWLP
jgi:hypothetical protein